MVEHVTAERISLIPGSLERIPARMSQFLESGKIEIIFHSDNDTDWSDTYLLSKRRQANERSLRTTLLVGQILH
jgi:hypothetical protein